MTDASAPVETTAPVETGTPVPQDGGAPAPDAEEGRSPIRKAILTVVIVLVGVGLVLVIIDFDPVRHWFALHTGILNGGPDKYYNFWSGFGSDLGEATLISAVGIGVYTGVRKVNCHTRGCWRIGHHRLDGTPYILCRHHHPDVPNGGASHQHILEQHRKYKEAQRASGAATGP